jgi:hypothetical protein
LSGKLRTFFHEQKSKEGQARGDKPSGRSGTSATVFRKRSNAGSTCCRRTKQKTKRTNNKQQASEEERRKDADQDIFWVMGVEVPVEEEASYSRGEFV